jgi:hypothetical protein
LVTQLNCTEETVAPFACTLLIARLVAPGVAVCALPGVTTPAHPARPKLEMTIVRTAVSSRNSRLLAERAALSIFPSPRRTANLDSARAKNPDRVPYALWRLLADGNEGNWTHDANEGKVGGRISTGLKGNTIYGGLAFVTDGCCKLLQHKMLVGRHGFAQFGRIGQLSRPVLIPEFGLFFLSGRRETESLLNALGEHTFLSATHRVC